MNTVLTVTPTIPKPLNGAGRGHQPTRISLRLWPTVNEADLRVLKRCYLPEELEYVLESVTDCSYLRNVKLVKTTLVAAKRNSKATTVLLSPGVFKKYLREAQRRGCRPSTLMVSAVAEWYGPYGPPAA